MRYAELIKIRSTDGCLHCGATIVSDPDEEVFVDRRDDFECAAAPRHVYDSRTGGSISGSHEPG